eukprot:m.13677 g.13677  ORF g.13677 m.13677 type:complete len:552 (+) comp2853_c0_seq1:1333-2988(+)
MDVIKAARDYITKMVRSLSGMKVLLLDEDTTSVVSMVFSQSSIVQEEVYLIERIDVTSREAMPHLNAIVFIRPTEASIEALIAELRAPKYKKYDLYFSNCLRKAALQRIAEADEHEVVNEVQEYFADYLAINPHLFTFNVVGCIGDRINIWRRDNLDRVHQGLVALLLSLRKRPAIRYQAASELCLQLAQDVQRSMATEAELFQGRVDTSSLLLIVDRRDDPVTPLLNQWTYQAMVHELLGIRNNRVDLRSAPGVPKELHEVVLSTADSFYETNLYKNFGEIGGEIRKLVDEYQSHTKSHEKLETIAQMKAFVEQYPEFKAKSASVSKHVTVVSELSRLVERQALLDVSELEQELACQPAGDTMARVKAILGNEQVTSLDRTRLLLLAMLRYDMAPAEVIEQLGRYDVPDELKALVPLLKRYAGNGTQWRVSDIFGTKGASGLLKRITGQLKDVENIYTQHQPLLAQTLDAILKGKVRDQVYPFIDAPLRDRPTDVIIFVVGGTTYEESRVVAQFNEANPSMRVVLGGTAIHNFNGFAEEMKAAQPALKSR